MCGAVGPQDHCSTWWIGDRGHRLHNFSIERNAYSSVWSTVIWFHNQTHVRNDAGNNVRSCVRQEILNKTRFLPVRNCSLQETGNTNCLYAGLQQTRKKKKRIIWRRYDCLNKACVLIFCCMSMTPPSELSITLYHALSLAVGHHQCQNIHTAGFWITDRMRYLLVAYHTPVLILDRIFDNTTQLSHT